VKHALIDETGLITLISIPRPDDMSGWAEVTDDAFAGMIWADGRAIQPAVDAEAELIEFRASASCSPLQGQLALGEERWGQVEAFVASPDCPWAMKRTVLSASAWHRNSSDIDALAWILGYTPEEVDDLFRLAMTL
jgi:hypothetical protein